MLNSSSSQNPNGNQPPIPLRRKPKPPPPPPPPTPPKPTGVELEELLHTTSPFDLKEEVSSKCELAPKPKPRVRTKQSDSQGNSTTPITEKDQFPSTTSIYSTGGNKPVTSDAFPRTSFIPKSSGGSQEGFKKSSSGSTSSGTSRVKGVNTGHDHDGLRNEELRHKSIKKFTHLSPFGNWKTLEASEKLHKILTKYVENDSGFKTCDCDTKVVKILENISNKHPTQASSPNQLLLWFKTHRESIWKIEKRAPGMITFFDRISRAFTVQPKDIKERHLEIVLVCWVAMGNMYESTDGNVKLVPPGFDSVKVSGKYSPDPMQNEVVFGYTIAPCGATIKVKAKKRPNLEFNEYIVNDWARVEVKYAVGVIVCPSVLVGDT